MTIEFTQHAKIRCIQRKIPEDWVVEKLSAIQYSPGHHDSLIKGTRLTIVYHDYDDIRTVITLYVDSILIPDPKEATRKLAQSNAIRDMVGKAVGKSKKRGKREKKMKKKK